MSFFRSKTKKTAQFRSDLASSSEVEAVFEKEREHLHWLSLVITGNAETAKTSVVDASGLSTTAAGVFREWLVRWAHSATARVATEAIRTDIFAAAEKYSDWSCSHSEHAVLSPEQATSLRALDAFGIASNLDALQRSVLVLRGMQNSSLAHCALLLNVPRRSVLGAYCTALQWARQQEAVNSAYRPLEQGASDDSQKVQTHEKQESYPSKGISQYVRTAIGPCNS